MADDAIL